MKFSKYNNPNRRKNNIYQNHSNTYREQMKNQLYELLAKCKTEEQKDALIKAYSITLNT